MASKKIVIEKSLRKRVLPSTAFTAGPEGKGVEFRFKKGEPSANPSGKAKTDKRLLSRSLRIQLANRAPDTVADALGLRRGASWAGVIAANLLTIAATSRDAMAVAAAREIREATESKPRPELFDDNGDGLLGNRIEVVFVGTEYPRQNAAPNLPHETD